MQTQSTVNPPTITPTLPVERPARRHRRLWRLHYPWLLQGISLVIVAAVLLPLIYLVMRAAGAGQEGLDYLLRPRTLQIITNSLILMGAVTVSAAVIGVPFAWLTVRTDLPYRRVWLVLGLVSMVIPSYLGAVTYLAAFGPRGMLQQMLEPLLGVQRLPDIRDFFGVWLVLTLFTYPYVVLPVRAALLNLDSSLEEAARSLGLRRWRVFLRVTLPQLRPAMAAGMLLAALYTLSDFGVVTMMRYNAFTRAIYLQTSSFRLERAALLALVLVALTLVLITLERRIATNRHHYRAGTGVQRQLQLVQLGKWRTPALVFCGVIVFLGVMVPVLVLVMWLVTHSGVEPVPVSMAELAGNTVSVSAMTALVVAVAALPLALLAMWSSSRWNRWLVNLAYTGHVLPGIVIALALVFFAANYLTDWYQTLPILILGYATRFLPFSISSTRSALTQISPRLEEAARSLGLRPWQATLKITVPLARGGIIAGTALVFLNVMKELPTTLILSPLGFRTFATRIWSSYEEAFLSQIGLPGLLLILVSAAALALILWRDKQIT